MNSSCYLYTCMRRGQYSILFISLNSFLFVFKMIIFIELKSLDTTLSLLLFYRMLSIFKSLCPVSYLTRYTRRDKINVFVLKDMVIHLCIDRGYNPCIFKVQISSPSFSLFIVCVLPRYELGMTCMRSTIGER